MKKQIKSFEEAAEESNCSPIVVAQIFDDKGDIIACESNLDHGDGQIEFAEVRAVASLTKAQKKKELRLVLHGATDAPHGEFPFQMPNLRLEFNERTRDFLESLDEFVNPDEDGSEENVELVDLFHADPDELIQLFSEDTDENEPASCRKCGSDQWKANQYSIPGLTVGYVRCVSCGHQVTVQDTKGKTISPYKMIAAWNAENSLSAMIVAKAQELKLIRSELNELLKQVRPE